MTSDSGVAMPPSDVIKMGTFDGKNYQPPPPDDGSTTTA